MHDPMPAQYTAEQLWADYRAFRKAQPGSAGWKASSWTYDLFDITGEPWFDAVVAILRVADPERDLEVLQAFGAQIYANGHAYYDRMERELASGGIKGANLAIVLSTEKPEFMDGALRARHRRLAARCG